jgi:hypothetical protein
VLDEAVAAVNDDLAPRAAQLALHSALQPAAKQGDDVPALAKQIAEKVRAWVACYVGRSELLTI